MYNRKTVEDHLGNRFESITAMCKFWDITESIFRNRVRLGWSLEEALTIKPGKKPKKTGKTCKDHLGNTYISIEEMCKAYNISTTAYCARIRHGWSLEEALTKKLHDFSCKDHLGNKFESVATMCRFWGIERSTYEGRIKLGWSVEKALTTIPIKEKTVTDHLGNEFESIRAMCKFWNIDSGTYRNRRKLGLPVEKALTTPVNEAKKAVTDHLGNEFESIRAMCKFWSINKNVYEGRIKSGWSVEKALTTPINKKNTKKEKVEDHLGNEFKSVAAMYKFWGVDGSTYDKRRKLGWSVEKALTTPPTKVETVTDHLGNEFESVVAMCKFWGISKGGYRYRRGLGWSVEKALTAPINEELKGKKVTDHLGNEFKSIRVMCKFWCINENTFKNRRKLGLSVEEALTTPLKDETATDHLGNEFKSVKDMCKFWDIDSNTYQYRIKLGWSVEKALTTIPIKEKTVTDHLGNEFKSITAMCKFWDISTATYKGRREFGWSVEEALTIPRNMYIGEYRVAEKLKKMHKKFYHDCSIKTIFKELNVTVDWKDFLNELQKNLGKAGYNWSVQKIQKLRPDFVIFTDEDNKIQGVIEFDGEQHQNFVEFFYKTIEQFYRRNNLDMAKQSLFEYLNIPMLRIRHDQVDKIDEMVEDFVKNSENYITRHNTYLTEDEYWSILKEEKKKLDLVFA